MKMYCDDSWTMPTTFFFSSRDLQFNWIIYSCLTVFHWDDARTPNWPHACTFVLVLIQLFEWQLCFKDLQTSKTQRSSREKPVYFVSQLIPLSQTSSPIGTVQTWGAARTCCWQDEVSFSPVWYNIYNFHFFLDPVKSSLSVPLQSL